MNSIGNNRLFHSFNISCWMTPPRIRGLTIYKRPPPLPISEVVNLPFPLAALVLIGREPLDPRQNIPMNRMIDRKARMDVHSNTLPQRANTLVDQSSILHKDHEQLSMTSPLRIPEKSFLNHILFPALGHPGCFGRRRVLRKEYSNKGMHCNTLDTVVHIRNFAIQSLDEESQPPSNSAVYTCFSSTCPSHHISTIYLASSGYRSSFRLTPNSSRRGFSSSKYCSYWPRFSTFALIPGTKNPWLTSGLVQGLGQCAHGSRATYLRRSAQPWGSR